MTTALTEIQPIEVSLVDRPANARPILVTKRDGQKADIIALAAAVGMSDESVEKINEITRKAEAAMADGEVAKMEFDADQLAALAAAATGEADEAQTEIVTSLLAQIAEAGGIYPKPEAIEQADEEAALADETVIEMSDVAKVELAKRDTEIAELRKSFTAERDIRLTAEFVQKAADYTNICEPKTLGPVLKRASESMTDADYQVLTKVLEQSQRIAKASAIFTEIGKKATGGDSSDPADQIEVIAKRLVSEGAASNIFKARAMAQADNPALVRAMNEDN